MRGIKSLVLTSLLLASPAGYAGPLGKYSEPETRAAPIIIDRSKSRSYPNMDLPTRPQLSPRLSTRQQKTLEAMSRLESTDELNRWIETFTQREMEARRRGSYQEQMYYRGILDAWFNRQRGN